MIRKCKECVNLAQACDTYIRAAVKGENGPDSQIVADRMSLTAAAASPPMPLGDRLQLRSIVITFRIPGCLKSFSVEGDKIYHKLVSILS